MLKYIRGVIFANNSIPYINMHQMFKSNFEGKSMLLCSNKIKGVNGSLLLFIDSNFFLGTMCAQIFYCSFQLPLVFHDHEKIHISCLTECLFRQVFYDSFCDNEYTTNTGIRISLSYYHINLYFVRIDVPIQIISSYPFYVFWYNKLSQTLIDKQPRRRKLFRLSLFDRFAFCVYHKFDLHTKTKRDQHL